jgi:hypothetical protein
MQAHEILRLESTYRIAALAREYRISRRQAEELLTEARQLVAAGAWTAELHREPTVAAKSTEWPQSTTDELPAITRTTTLRARQGRSRASQGHPRQSPRVVRSPGMPSLRLSSGRPGSRR